MTDTCELSSYGELADILANLAMLVRERRRQTRTSVRSLATATGLSASTISRFENGQGAPELAAVEQLVRWLGSESTSTSKTTRASLT